MNLSEHFSYDELTRSEIALRHGFENMPPSDAVMNLQHLCEFILEPVRSLLDCPLHINSGYRSPTLNRLVGGAIHSAHMEGRAADFVPIGFSLHDAFDVIRHTRIPYDQLIIECNAWLHISIPTAHADPRREALTATGGPGAWVYEVAK